MNFSEKEQEILKFWEKDNTFQKLREKNKDNKNWSFLDGPITANNPMGVHHAWGRTYKDLFQRYKAMQGYNQRFQNGFDCQGLWVEVEVEKEKGFKSKKDIEAYGVERFIQDCKDRVIKYSQIQTEQSIRLGQWMDWDNSYYTMSEENNYAIWAFLKKCKEDDLLYKGDDVVPWCLRCGCSISQHEILTEAYKEVTHQSVFLKCQIIGQENTYLLVWTTTPWTLVANTALAVHPDLIYLIISDQGNKYILLKEKRELIKGRVEKEVLGKDLKGLKYQSIFGEGERPVVLWKEINTEEGTGVVHIAPGCGQEDFKLSKELKLELINPLDDESCYKSGFLKGKRADQVNDLIFERLKEKIYKIQEYKHRYPVCWRCKTELIFRLVPEWYISMDRLRKKLMKTAKNIKWIPKFGLEREIDWLKNMDDWLISKKRYWGLALPIFECSCGNFEVIGSKEELREKTVEGWKEDQSPHKPWVDEVKIECTNCKKLISRIPDVGNPWLDAGIVPFSTMNYFSDKKEWERWFPADLICESFPGQFKNWFYSLIVMSFVLEKEKPSKTIFGFALVKDEKGEEMHKSAGNAIWLSDAIEEIGADPLRWVYAKQNPALNLNFGYQKAQENQRKLMTLKNIFVFFSTHVKKEELKESDTKNILDKWIVSKLNNLISKTTEALDSYDACSAALLIEDFFINDLSLWYLRRSRKRIQKEQPFIFYKILLELVKLIAPILPFLAEELYALLKREGMPESVHLQDWPSPGETNQEIEEKMEITRELVGQAMTQRAALQIKTRQPLSELKIKKDIPLEYQEILKEEINVKKISVDKSLEEDIYLNPEITPELEKEGVLREIIRQIQFLRKKAQLKPEDKISIYCFGSSEINQLLIESKELIKKEIIAEDIAVQENEGEEVKINDQFLKIHVSQA